MSHKNYNIGIFHYIANFTDGVSLEMNKWRHVFEDMGHIVHYCAGKYGTAEETVVEEMYHHIPEIKRLNFNLAPDTINVRVAPATASVLHANFSDLKSPALNHNFAATVAKSIFTGVARHVAGINIL